MNITYLFLHFIRKINLNLTFYFLNSFFQTPAKKPCLALPSLARSTPRNGQKVKTCPLSGKEFNTFKNVITHLTPNRVPCAKKYANGETSEEEN